MKITKSELQQIIKEETAAVLSESDDWYDSEKGYETFADRLWADNPASQDYAGEWPAPDVPDFDKAGEWPEAKDPDSDDDDAQELAAGLDLTGFELTKDRGYYFIVDKDSGERVLGPFRTEKQAAKRAMRSDTRSEFEAAQDVLSKLGR